MNMNHKQNPFTVLTLALIAMLLAACGGPSDEEKAAAEQLAKAKKVVKQAQPADPLAGMSSAVTGSKGVLPVDVRFELLDVPQIDKPLNVRVAFVPTSDLIALHAVIKSVAALKLADNEQVKFEMPKTGEIKEFKFVATPSAGGILVATIDVTVTRDTGDTTFTFSLPVAVPDADSTAVANASTKSK